MNEKLGITFDGVKTGQYADIMSANRPMTPAERLILQRGVNNIYNTFITKVANGRKKTKAQVDSLGGGRVWTGKDAVANGLADRIGSFGDAISSAAKKAKLKDYKVVEYPEKIDPLKEFLGAAKDNVSAYYAKKEFGENYVLYQQMKKALSQTGIQARLDHEIIIK